MTIEPLPQWIEAHPRESVAVAGALVLLVAFIDLKVEPNISLGLLYVFPVILASMILSRWQSAVLALMCALLREALSPFRWQPEYPVRILVTSGIFWGVGTLISEMDRNRRLTVDRLRQEQQHLFFQREADQQLRILIEASPLSILISDGAGNILLANNACCELLATEGNPCGQSIFTFLPALKPLLPDVPIGGPPARLETESAAIRFTGEIVFAHVWLTVYWTTAGLLSASNRRIAWVLWDASDDLRGRELAHSASLETTARVLLASFSHEIRNLSSAAGIYVARISSRPDGRNDPDIKGLSSIIHSLAQFAAAGLQTGRHDVRSVADLGTAMDQVRITVQSSAELAQIRLIWSVADRLPLVYVDQGSLIQLFLNLLANSEAAMRGRDGAEVTVVSEVSADAVIIRFWDNGPGVRKPEQLFKPFFSDSGGAGLGLYLSHAILKSFGGDLYYEPASSGACFVVRLHRAPEVDS